MRAQTSGTSSVALASPPQADRVDGPAPNPDWDALPAILTPAEIARVMSISRNTVYAQLQRHELPGRKCGAQWRTGKRALMKFVEGEE